MMGKTPFRSGTEGHPRALLSVPWCLRESRRLRSSVSDVVGELGRARWAVAAGCLVGLGIASCMEAVASPSVTLFGFGSRTRTLEWENGDVHRIDMNIEVYLKFVVEPAELRGGQCGASWAGYDGMSRVWGEAVAWNASGDEIDQRPFARTRMYQADRARVEMAFHPGTGEPETIAASMVSPLDSNDVVLRRVEYSAAKGTINVWVTLPGRFGWVSDGDVTFQWYEIGGEAQAEEIETGFAGRVYDECSGKPLSGAEVDLGGIRRTTGADGRFVVEAVPTGPLTVTVTKEGYEPYRATKPMPAICPVNQDFWMDPLAPEIIGLDDLEKQNRSNHRTSRFQETVWDGKKYMPLRRGIPVEFELVLSHEAGACDSSYRYEVVVEIYDAFSPAGSPLVLSPGVPPEARDGWSIEGLRPFIGGKRRVAIRSPINAPAGEYELIAAIRDKITGEVSSRTPFPRRLAMLFNPWHADDLVGGLSQWDLGALVTDETIVYFKDANTHRQGTHPALDGTPGKDPDFSADPIPSKHTWRADQFDPIVLRTTLHFLGELAAEPRRSPMGVVKHLVQRVNVEASPGEPTDAPGLLTGKWDRLSEEELKRHRAPGTWSGSAEVMARYWADANAVRYVQCPEFACVLTSMLRCLGIPSRTVTGYNIGRDLATECGRLELGWRVDASLGSDRRIVKQLTKCGDYLWNYHVWTEAWFSSESSVPGEWQVMDGTPVAAGKAYGCEVAKHCAFHGIYGLGPVPRSAILGRDLTAKWDEGPAGLGYLASSVRAPVVLVPEYSDDPKLLKVPRIAWDVVVHNHSADFGGPASVAALYRGAESGGPRSLASLAPNSVFGEVTVDFRGFLGAPGGSDLVFEVELINRGEDPVPFEAVVSVFPMEYRGVDLGVLDNGLDELFVVEGGETVLKRVVIRGEEYGRWIGTTPIFEGRLFVSRLDSGTKAVGIESVVLGMPAIHFEGLPDGPLSPGQVLALTLGWTNSTPVDLTSAQVVVSGSRGIRFGGEANLTLPAPELLRDLVFRQTIDVTVEEAGNHYVSARLLADGMGDVYGDVWFKVGGTLRVEVRRGVEGMVVLSFPTQLGWWYRVERIEGLDAGRWELFGEEVKGTGLRVEVGVAGGTGRGSSYYRVVSLEE